MPACPELHRRSFLQRAVKAALAATLLTIPGDRSMEEQDCRTQAERFLHELPPDLPGVRSVDGVRKYPVAGSKHCLVHIRQVHGIEHVLEKAVFDTIRTLPTRDQLVIWKVLWGVDLDRLSYPWINEQTRPVYRKFFDAPAFRTLIESYRSSRCSNPVVHENIRRIVEHLVETYGLSAIHLEGVHEEFASVIGKLPALKQNHARQRSALLSQQGGQHRKNETLMRAWNADASLEYLEATRDHRLGSLSSLYASGKIRILPDASDALAADVDAVFSRYSTGKELRLSDPELREFIDVRRERELLSQGAGESVVLARFGGAHRWWPRIQEWNADRPADRYSLIEITPEGYQEDSRS